MLKSLNQELRQWKVLEPVQQALLVLASRGQTIGKPRLITGVAEFRKCFGGYLGEEFGEHRFLSYAVDQFFANGGSSCYVMRVASSEQVSAFADIEDALKVTATSSGTWGNAIKVQIRKAYQAKTYVTRQATEDEVKKKSIHSEFIRWILFW